MPAPSSIVSSLPKLRDALVAYFTAQSITSKVYLGLKYRDLWDTSRVVFIDGEFDGSNTPRVRSAGNFGAPWQKATYNPRELVAWSRPVTLSIRAVDPTQPDSEDAQIEAIETLIEQTVQGIHNATLVDVAGVARPVGQNNIDWQDSKAFWCDPGTATQQTWGKEFLVSFVYKCVLLDVYQPQASPRPQLQKGPLLDTLVSGRNLIVEALAGTSATLGGFGGMCQQSWVGMSIRLSGAAYAGNNGTFSIVYFAGPNSLVIHNAAAVFPDANSGAIAWAIVPS